MRAALVASCLRGALPPVDLRAVCLVRAIVRSAVTSERGIMRETGKKLVERVERRERAIARVCWRVNGLKTHRMGIQ